MANHKWRKVNNKKDEPQDVCIICDCKRIHHYTHNRKIYSYIRSNMIFGTDRPDCVDMKKEDLKTID